MDNHIRVTFPGIQPEQQEILVACLAEAGYEGFEEEELALKAYIPEQQFDGHLLKEIAFKYQLPFTQETIPAQNWNSLWESSFQPVIVDDFACIRADFHPPAAGVRYDILITPKMSFGTGHHATTCMMIRAMKDIDFNNKSVFDFGTGTGVLAILAEQCGANNVLAVDNDDWSLANSAENLEKNRCRKTRLERAETVSGSRLYDVILANINRNIILENLPAMAAALRTGGQLLLSGLLEEDKASVVKAANQKGLHLLENLAHMGWICLRFGH